ncbi:hypothetical protein ACJMK2_037912 [Sinanodonta woodiana]|uniref:AMOP domain-containing protein n=1 Tax=Sinanodonta woodiana TaxID=1069815 RepID=A0ABD3WNB1_SINWO
MNTTYTWTPQYVIEPTFPEPTKDTKVILPPHRQKNKKRRKKQRTRKKNRPNSKEDHALGHGAFEVNSDEDIDIYSRCKDCKIRKRKGRNQYIFEPGLNNISLSTLRKIFETVADNALSGGGTWNSLYGEGSQGSKRQNGHHKTNDLPGKDGKNKLLGGPGSTDVQKRPWVHEESEKNIYSNDELGPWSEWSPCSVTCGTGQQERMRTCGPSCKEVESMICMKPCKDGSQSAIDNSSLSEFYLGEGDGFVPPIQSVEEDYLDPEVDNCGKWIDCNKKHVAQYLLKSELPACPCFYPLQQVKNRNLWDSGQRKEFNWIDFSAPNMLIYKPGAKYCIVSKLGQGTKTLAVQQCCYDDSLRLVTGGKAAGTPILISPDISEELHWKVDLLPWVICKGDWTRYNQVLPTNNNLKCEINPDEAELHRQAEEAMQY